MPPDLGVSEVRPFLPAREFETSLAFYAALGWETVWTDGESLARLSLGGHHLMFQNYYVREWAENWMLVVDVDVDDAAAWHDHVSEVLASGDFGDTRVAAPAYHDFGAIVTYVWDPCDVLLDLTQWDAPG